LREHRPQEVSRGLIIDMPWIELILEGRKDWEMRTRATRPRGRIALIPKGSGAIYGLATLIEVKGPFGREQLLENAAHRQATIGDLRAGRLINGRTHGCSPTFTVCVTQCHTHIGRHLGSS
jgi:hypothetical protein